VTTKQDKWADVVREMGLDLSKPLNYVSAAEVKRITHEEPRLMASMDSRERLPSVFSERGLFVLPVSNGRYAIVRGRGYQELEDVGEPRPFASRLPFELSALAYGTGETGRILHAFHSGVLTDFTGVPEMYQAIGGRSRTSNFEFRVDGSGTISVEGAGMEVDMGFEGRDSLILIEGKAHHRENFLIRQLYYPYRSFRDFQPKNVRAFFFVADAGTFSLWEYRWEDPLDYESIKLSKAESYRLVAESPPVGVFESIEPDPNLDIIPQADDFEKVAEFPLLVSGGVTTPKAWMNHYAIAYRQAYYYKEAAKAMGFVSSDGGPFVLTAEGRKYVSLEPKERGDYLAGRILRIPIMNRVFHRVQQSGTRGVGKEEVARLIATSSQLTGSTLPRRAGTVFSFFRWMGQTTGAVVVRDGRIYSRSSQARWVELKAEASSQ
jgi:hypothetical protein